MKIPIILDTIRDIQEMTHGLAIITIFNFNVGTELQALMVTK